MSLRGLFRDRNGLHANKKKFNDLRVNKMNFNGIDVNNNNNSFISIHYEAMGDHNNNNNNNNNSSQVSIIDTVNVDLCMVITFNTKVHDKMKVLMLSNTISMYEALRPRVKCFLVNTNNNLLNVSDYEVLGNVKWPWEKLEPPDTNEHGTPLFMSLLKRVDVACPGVPLLAYANADILFEKVEMFRTLDALLQWNRDGGEFVGVGRRSNHDLTGVLDPRDVTRVNSELFVDVAQDYFIFSRGIVVKLFGSLPPYVIGRRAYDNAIVDWAYHKNCLIDLTETLTIVISSVR